MTCPLCDATTYTTVNVRVQHESDAKQLAGSAWDGRSVARCDDCGVLYDHRVADSGDAVGDASDDASATGESSSQRVNCPDCGALNDGDLDACSVCGTRLE
jgi:hypothetical protein